MKISDSHRQILASIGHTPRTSRYFTSGLTHTSPSIVLGYISHLADAGLIDPPERHDGPYTITDDGRDCLALAQPVPSRYFGNASMTEPYKPPKMESPRTEANRNCEILSAGTPT